MAVLALTADELVEGYRSLPINDHGKLRTQFFSLPAQSVAADANSTVELFDLPQGRVRVLPSLSRLTNSAWGSSRTLSIGHRAYASRDPGQADPEAENASAFISAMDVSGAQASVAWSTVLKYDIYSKSGVRVFATVAGGTLPVGGSFSGFMVYIYE